VLIGFLRQWIEAH